MEVVETFLSLQGEGKYSGNLAVFVRFAGCNFNCIGFGVKKEQNSKILLGCDTIRAVFTQEFKACYQSYKTKELFDEVVKLANSHQAIVVITGGEPLLNYQKPEFLCFVNLLLENDFKVHFETNASIEIDFEKYPLYKKCYFALGVKLSNSGVKKEKRINEKALRAFKKYPRDSFYKFVLDRDFLEENKALEEIKEILQICKNEVFCMPMGANGLEISKNALSVAEFCIKNGYNYSDRMHIRIWGDKEGV